MAFRNLPDVWGIRALGQHIRHDSQYPLRPNKMRLRILHIKAFRHYIVGAVVKIAGI